MPEEEFKFEPPSSQPGADEDVPLSRIAADNSGKWVLVQVTRFDETGEPLLAKFLTSSTTRERLSETLALLPPASPDPGNPTPYYVFHSGPVDNRRENRRVLKALLRHGLENQT